MPRLIVSTVYNTPLIFTIKFNFNSVVMGSRLQLAQNCTVLSMNTI